MRALLLAVVLATVTAGVGLAAAGEKVQLRFNAADQAAARRAVAKRADLGAAAWQGGATKPDLSAAPTCANFHPKQHDLVMTGAASSKWTYSGLEIDTQSQVLKTPAMVAADWARTVVAPAAIPCLRSHLVKELGKGVAFVSFRRVLFPAVATFSRAYVVLVDVKTTTGATVRVAIEVVIVGHGRTELTITSTAPNAAQKVVAQADAQLARALVARAAKTRFRSGSRSPSRTRSRPGLARRPDAGRPPSAPASRPAAAGSPPRSARGAATTRPSRAPTGVVRSSGAW